MVIKEMNNRLGTDSVSCKHTFTHTYAHTHVEDVERKVSATRKAKKRENAYMPVRPQIATFSQGGWWYRDPSALVFFFSGDSSAASLQYLF